MKMKFEIYNSKTDKNEAFEAEVNDGLNRLMSRIMATVDDGSLYGEAGKIYSQLKSCGIYVNNGIYKVVGMTHREFIREFGLSMEDYHRTIDGWINMEHADEHLDSLFVDRYMLLCGKPFREVNKMFDAACGRSDSEIDTIQEWLGERAMPDDFKAMKD